MLAFHSFSRRIDKSDEYEAIICGSKKAQEDSQEILREFLRAPGSATSTGQKSLQPRLQPIRSPTIYSDKM